MNVSALPSLILLCPLAWNCTVRGSLLFELPGRRWLLALNWTRAFGVVCSHRTAYDRVRCWQHRHPGRSVIHAALLPALPHRSSSPSVAPAAAGTLTPSSTGLPGRTVRAPTGREPSPGSPQQVSVLGTGL